MRWCLETGSLASTSADPSFGRELRVWTRVNLHHLLVAMVVVIPGVGGTDGASELVAVRRENTELNGVHVLNTWMTHMKYRTLFTRAEEMTRNKYLGFQLLWAWSWLPKRKQNHTSLSVPLLCEQSQGCQGGVEQDFTPADPEILTNTPKSYTPAAPGVVSSAGAAQRHERKQNCRLKTFPSRWEKPKPQQTCRSLLRAGQQCCCPGENSRVGAASVGGKHISVMPCASSGSLGLFLG